MHEPNLPRSWSPRHWIGQPDQSPETYNKYWQHVWKVFRDEGANEYATWMLEYWNGNPPGDYYPGDEYVDWLGLSCQSWWSGTTGRQGPYRSLGELVSPNYDYWTSVHKDKPIMIGEMSTEKHTKQHEWYIDAFRYIKTRPRIGAAIIIDVPYGDFTFGQDLILTAESRKALREVFKDPYWILAH